MLKSTATFTHFKISFGDLMYIHLIYLHYMRFFN